jgi:hypothetical protein
MIAAGCVCFSAALQAAVVVETFTDYTAFLKTLGAQAQVVTFDEVPTLPFGGVEASNPNRWGYFDPNRYAAQGLVIRAVGVPTVSSGPAFAAVSPPNVYYAGISGGPAVPPLSFGDESRLFFTRGGGSALSSAFGTFFIGNTSVNGVSYSSLVAYGADGSLLARGDPATTTPGGSTFLGFAAVDSATGELVPALSQVDVFAGKQNLVITYLDNFTFAAPASPVPEGNGWVLLAATALAAAVGWAPRRARSSLMLGFVRR